MYNITTDLLYKFFFLFGRQNRHSCCYYCHGTIQKLEFYKKRKKAIYSFIPILYIFSLILVQKTRNSSQQYMLLDWIHSLLLQILQHENKRYHITLPFSLFLGGGALFASLMRCGMFLLILEWNFSHIMHAPNRPKRRGKKK